ncbi:Uncharacterised protein [Segatella copri]|nr:Uncharacterised protein [Segatella copri]
MPSALSKRNIFSEMSMPHFDASSTCSRDFSIPALSSSLLPDAICCMSTEMSAVLFFGMALR